MPLAASAVPLAISAIQSLLKYRRRIDEILSIRETSAGLPFLLPDAPSDDQPHWKDMINFFSTPNGKTVLLLNSFEEIFIEFETHVNNDTTPDFSHRKKLYRLYCEASGKPIETMGPGDPILDRPKASLAGGSSPEILISYYVVTSERLSTNSAVTRIILSTADTLLEIAGPNAGIFISDPRTKAITESLITHFAVNHDFDDDKSELILKRLLGSAILAFAENPGKIAEKPALKPLFEAFGNLRTKLIKDFGKEGANDFVANIISHESFNHIVSNYLTHVAKDSSFISDNKIFQDILADTLLVLAEKFDDIQNDPKAFLDVLEAFLSSSAENANVLLEAKLGDNPLLTTVLGSILDNIKKLGDDNLLFESISSGEILSSVYKTALKAIADNPNLISNELELNQLVADLIAGVAGIVSEYKPGSDLLSKEVFHRLLSNTLEILSKEPNLFGKNQAFANKLLQSIFKVGSEATKDGLSTDDLLEIVQAAIETTSNNVGLLKLDDKLASIIEIIGTELVKQDFGEVLKPKVLKNTLISIMKTIAQNPTVWGQFQEKDLVQPIIIAVLSGLESDKSNLLSEENIKKLTQQILLTLARHGNKLIDESVTTDTIKNTLIAAFDRVEKEVGVSIDGENLEEFIKRVLTNVLTLPDPNNIDDDALNDLFASNLKNMVAA